MYQETSNNDSAAVAKTDSTNSGSTSEIAAASDGVPQANSLPSVGQICGIHMNGQIDVLWVDGSRSSTYPHQLYVVGDEVLQSNLLSSQPSCFD